MNRIITQFVALTLAAVTLSSPVIAAPGPLQTSVVIRAGSSILYYSGCNANANMMEPGDAAASVLNVTTCATYTTQSTAGASWVIIQNVTYGDVYVSGTQGAQHFFDCSLIRSQIISGGSSARQTITVECVSGPLPSGEITSDGFDS